MTTVKEWLEENRDEIKCTACGNCCHGFQSPCRFLAQSGLCSIHPEVVGIDNREELEPTCAPDTDPYEVMVLMGFYCPPLGEKIERQTGIRLQPTNVWISTDHATQICGKAKVYSDRIDLDQILNLKIS